MKYLITRLLIWLMGGEAAFVERYRRELTKHRAALVLNLDPSKVVSWQAEMVLRYVKTEHDIPRMLALQNLAIAMIEQEEVLNPGDGPEDIKAMKKRMTAKLMGMKDIIEKNYDA